MIKNNVIKILFSVVVAITSCVVFVKGHVANVSGASLSAKNEYLEIVRSGLPDGVLVQDIINFEDARSIGDNAAYSYVLSIQNELLGLGMIIYCVVVLLSRSAFYGFVSTIPFWGFLFVFSNWPFYAFIMMALGFNFIHKRFVF
ncbi:hypothetical protein [Ferrimonas pelagia]|uniref:Lipoprotein n=1 Tax=Ferrimonas pelagia TaxID=1177826 RepID=A0ABP9EID2_9GAMM